MQKLHNDLSEGTKVFAYVRVSTNKQKSGLDSQKTAIQNYCDEYGLHIDGWFEDFAVSATKVPIYERKGYMDMEAAIENEYWTTPDHKRPLVIICDINRLMRTKGETDYVTVAALCDCYAQVISLDQHLNYSDCFQEIHQEVQRRIKIYKTLSTNQEKDLMKENIEMFIRNKKHQLFESCWHLI